MSKFIAFPYILFAITVIFQAASQTMEKYGLNQMGRIDSVGGLFNYHNIMAILRNPFIMGGVALSAIALFMWLCALSNFKLHYMFSMGSITYILVAVSSAIFLKESITIVQWLGVCTIVIGCVLINY